MTVFTFSEAGGKPANEDAVRVEPHPADPSLLLVAVADGQGGRSGGGRAARLAVDRTIALAGERRPTDLISDATSWLPLLLRVDRAVCDDPEAGFTTLIGMAIHTKEGVAVGASNGDSAVLLVDARGNETWTAGQPKNPPLGSGEAAFSPMAGSPDRPWRFVVMTDGVWKFAGWREVIGAAERLRGQDVIHYLAGRARLPRSGAFPDDFTLVVVESGP